MPPEDPNTLVVVLRMVLLFSLDESTVNGSGSGSCLSGRITYGCSATD